MLIISYDQIASLPSHTGRATENKKATAEEGVVAYFRLAVMSHPPTNLKMPISRCTKTCPFGDSGANTLLSSIFGGGGGAAHATRIYVPTVLQVSLHTQNTPCYVIVLACFLLGLAYRAHANQLPSEPH